MSRLRSHYLLLLLTLLGISTACYWITARWVYEQGLQELRSHSLQQLDRFISHLSGQLARYAFLPELLAKNRYLIDVLNDAKNPARIDVANHYLEEVNQITGAADTYLMDVSGMTLAASNWRSERPFVGSNFNFRPYFQQAMQGGLGRYFALGTTSERRGYYYAYPVTHAASIIGVMVLKMDLSDIEMRWSGKEEQYLVTDPDGIIFITTRPEWLYRSVVKLTDAQRQLIVESMRYPGASFDYLQLLKEVALPGGGAIVRIVSGTPDLRGAHLSLSHHVPEAGWSVRILSPMHDVRRNVLTTLAVLTLSLLLLGSLVDLLLQRNHRRRERERFQAEAKRGLEQEVVERTADLTREIEQHRRTEQALRSTRDELVQAAKLAMLGQLSASISHEMNNPLAAIRSYADNAREFLAREQDAQVSTNLARISELTDRMAKISSQLKMFARKTPSQLEEIAVRTAIKAAMDIVHPQSKHNGVDLQLNLPPVELYVKADVIQLEQVLINLLSNAIQAVEAVDRKTVMLSSEAVSGHVFIHVDDSGPGIPDDHLAQIFDPFFTTKETGLGLGLSISYRIIDSMYGQLTARNLDAGGARFTIALPIVEKSI